MTAIGYGKSSSSDNSSAGVLREVELPLIVPTTDCYRGSHPFADDDGHRDDLCAGTRSGTPGTCTGDSGGPLVAFAGGVPFVVATVSRGDCEQGPTLYARTAQHADWIGDHISLTPLPPTDLQVAVIASIL